MEKFIKKTAVARRRKELSKGNGAQKKSEEEDSKEVIFREEYQIRNNERKC